jgi:hypothetical protein
MRALYKFVTHSISLDPQAERDLDEMECTTCHLTSGVVKKLDDGRDWAMQHTGQTHHTGFRLTTTNHYRVTRHEGPVPTS